MSRRDLCNVFGALKKTNYALSSPFLGEGHREITRGATISHLRDLLPLDIRMAVSTAFRVLGFLVDAACL